MNAIFTKQLYVWIALYLCLSLSSLAQSVTVTSVTPNPVCAGSIINASYTYSSVDPATAFVYLNGPNTTNVLIGQAAVSGGNASVAATIPADRATGSYTVFVRRVSSTTGTIDSPTSSAITVNALPPPPTVSNVSYCQGAAATSLVSSLTATGTSKWYTVASGGIGSTVAPTPTTSTPGTTTYYVSQVNANGCESGRAALTVTVTNCNVFIGTQAGQATTTGTFNTFVGIRAGTTNTTGNSNTLLGNQANVTSANLTNAAAIGANALVAVSNAIVLGDSVAGTKVGIGLTAPQFPLDVKGIINIRGKGTLKFSHLTNPTLREGTTDQFLTVNEQGETVLATYRLHIDKASDWADKVFEQGYALRSLTEVETHIRQHGHLPGFPSAEQVAKDGINLPKMNAMLLEKIEELTLYSIRVEKADHAKQQKLDQLQNEINELKQLVKHLLDQK